MSRPVAPVAPTPEPHRTARAPEDAPRDDERDRSPEADGRRRSALGWILLGIALLLLGALMTLFVARDWTARPPFDPEGPGADGARAIVNILRDRGVDVVPAVRREEAAAVLDGDTTLVLADTRYLSDETVLDLVERAGDTVVLAPQSATADLLIPGSEPAGYGDGPVAPECTLPAAERAGSVAPGRAFTAAPGATGCYPVDDGYALLQAPSGSGGTVTLIDGSVLFGNAHLAEAGNAALGLGLIGTHARVVWYVPSIEDADVSTAPPTLGDLVPPWLTPAIVLLMAAAGAAAAVQGRRLGPLVAERLPVTVRGSETLEGRARLYARSADAAHAARVLRDGAAARLARRLGLAPHAAPAEVADAAAARVGAAPTAAREILLPESAGGWPATDRELAAFGERLRRLEEATDAATGALDPRRSPS
ncbi:DUF4350 domain-containing protein [Microbacterium album]|uniref:DUF4350 domain-containing protein n=1 Tax=Microbacterium album TaxID=2053191 RepID=A0A917MLE6_9MICO|nr:DUF4350 domain-containing protein [Microbacterium album]GGH37670.1 hypothetical protein GCM10010921_07750 [Microbacterium album]